MPPPPRLDEAHKYLTRRCRVANGGSRGTRGLFNVWVEESSGGNEAKVIELAKRFLDTHGTSSFALEFDEVAELYYRRQDLRTRSAFGLIAQRNSRIIRG